MLKRMLRLFGLVSKQEILTLQTENQLLKIKIERLEKQVELLLADNGELSEKLSAYQKADLSALKSIMEEFDMLMLERMEPVGDA